MLTRAEALGLVVAELGRMHLADLVILDEETIEREWGWVFFYNSQRYLETGDILHALAGNAPYLVNRHTGELQVTGTAHPTEHYIAEYQRHLRAR
jgi:immunity protein 35 of polymorphic toxin system